MMMRMIIIIIIIIFSLQSTVMKTSRSQMLYGRLTAIQKLILAHRVLKIAPMNPFVLCQPTNAAAHSNKCVTPLVIPPHGRLFARSKRNLVLDSHVELCECLVS